MPEFLFPLVAVGLGYTVLGLTGFGSALVIVPLLAWQWPLPEVVALTLLLDLPASLAHSGLNWRLVQWQELRRLLPGMVAGTLAGLWLAQHLSSRWPLLVLGLYIAVVGLRALRVAGAAHQPPPLAVAWASAYGAGIGVVEMLFGTAGPVAVAWMTRRLSEPQQVRASIPVVMVVAVLTVLASMTAQGRLSQPELWQRWLILIGPALAGVWLGHRLVRRVPAARLRQTICGLLVVSGSVLAVKAVV